MPVDCEDLPALTHLEQHGYADSLNRSMQITLNGEPYPVPAPLSLLDLLSRLEIDPRRVAVEHNLVVVRRAHYGQTVVKPGDEVEIVNFVGGG